MNLSILADPFLLLAGSGFLIILLIAIVSSIFWLWMLIDAIKRQFANDTEKVVWIAVVFFGHLIGALIYYFAGRGGTRGGPVV